MTYTLQFKQLFRKKKNILTIVSIQAAILPTTSRFDISSSSSSSSFTADRRLTSALPPPISKMDH